MRDLRSEDHGTQRYHLSLLALPLVVKSPLRERAVRQQTSLL